jgi:DNA-binding transcriptional LysR family regulator
MMYLRLLDMFNAVVEQGSVTQAARTLGVTQPAVSGGLARLEQQIGFALLRRDGRAVAPTAEGKLFYEEATRVLAGIAQLQEAATAIGAAQRGTLTVASNPNPGIAWLPTVVARFRDDRPEVSVRLLTRSSSEVRDLVQARVFDLGIAEPPFDRSDTLLRRYRFQLVATLPPTHPLAVHQTLTPRLLEDHAFIVTTQSRSSYTTVSRAFDAEGIRLKPMMSCEFFATALNLVVSGAGISLIEPISATAAAAAHGLVLRTFTPAVFYEVGLLRPARGELSRLAAAFVAAFDTYVAPFQVR